LVSTHTQLDDADIAIGNPPKGRLARKPAELARRTLAETGAMAATALEGLRRTWEITRWWPEYVTQCLFLIRVTTLPVMLIAVPLGATISLQVGQLTRQLGAESLTGAVVIVGVVREAAPIAAALLIAGAGGSAMTADMGARNIRDELAAMEVMAVNPTHRLVTPRLWAATTVGLLLVSLIILSGVAGGYLFNVVLQGVSPGAYFQGADDLLRLSDLGVALFKAGLFGFMAATVACHRGMRCERSPVGVGAAVKEAVVMTLLAVFIVNYVITSLYTILVPQELL
jgi:phospholipid/cholesterol/gamma-HCH transport system permease protein